MALWSVSTSDDTIRFGSKARRMTGNRGCNEPFKGNFWCPGRKWFAKEPCPFVSKAECDNYRRMCGAI
uniref:Uncharacterized protein n=1 Tax=Fundidesulfovibrio putealis TaxID=270496 RepID=A0A7C4AG66_9BACT